MDPRALSPLLTEIPAHLGDRPSGGSPAPYRVAPAPPARALLPVKAPPRPAPLRAKELAAAVGLAIVLDLALFSRDTFGAGGFGASLVFTAIPLLLFAAARKWRGSVRLGVVVALLSLVAIRSALSPTVGTTFAGLVLLVALSLSLRVRRPFVPEAITSALSAVAKIPSRIAATAAGVRRLAKRTRLERIAILPVAIPAVLTAVFLGVFAFANPLVAHGLGVVADVIARVGLPGPERVLTWAAAIVVAASLLRPACRLPKDREDAAPAGEAAPASVLLARNTLVGLNVLFFGYNALDAAYLWSGRAPSGMTTREYAHAGAFWLTVALVMLTAVVSVLFRGALAQDARAERVRKLAFVWMGQGLVLALGAYRRIGIHVTHSGLSDLRIVGILGTTLVVWGVVLVAWKLRTGRAFTWLVRRQLDAFVLTLVVYAVAPTHWIAARVNVARVTSGEYRPVLHVFRQSQEVESAAVLVPLLEHPDHRVRQGVAALLEGERDRLRGETARASTWRMRDVLTGRTLSALEAASSDIAAELGSVDRAAAKRSLLEISRVANEDRSLEELLAVPDAEGVPGAVYERGAF